LGFINNVNGVRRVPYNLPALLAADASQPVFVTEGEKDADALGALDLVATTNPGGAGKWQREYGEHLRGRDVVVLPDNDDARRNHAAQVQAALTGVARSVRVLPLPNLPAKGDVSDWLANGGTRDELPALVDKTADALLSSSAASQPTDATAPQPDATQASTPTSPGDADEATLSDEAFEAEVARLVALPPLRYARQRIPSAKKMGVPPGTLDRLVRDARGDNDSGLQGKAPEFPAPEPWQRAVNGAALLRTMAHYFARHAILPPGANHALALWCLHCFCFDPFALTPRLQITAATKEAGKSTVLELIKGVVPKPLETEASVSQPCSRVIAQHRPTLLLDEADTLLRDRPDLCRIVNAGNKPGGSVLRVEGENLEVRAFDVHAPIVIAGIGRLTGTTESRCIRITMQRRRRSEAIRPIDDATRAIGERLRRKAARWVDDNAAKLRKARPNMGGLFNGRADLWRPLYAIADAAEREWPDLARKAQGAIAAGADDDADSIGEMMLADVRRAFDDVAAEDAKTQKEHPHHEIRTELPTGTLVDRLIEMPQRPWPEMGRTGKPLTKTRLTRTLGKFGIQRRRLVVKGEPADWSFRLTDFEDAFGRYLDV